MGLTAVCYLMLLVEGLPYSHLGFPGIYLGRYWPLFVNLVCGHAILDSRLRQKDFILHRQPRYNQSAEGFV